jgi:hypothetical protein
MNHLLQIIQEATVMLESRARRFGLDLTQADYTIGFYTTAQGIPIVTSIAPNFLVRIA